jgi:hypothetical protein
MEHKSEKHKDIKGTNKKLIIMATVIALLLVVSGVQAFELVSLKNKLNNELTALSSGGAKASAGVLPNSALANNLKNLPSMVGGC